MNNVFLAFLASISLFASLNAQAEESLAQATMDACKSDIEKYCSKVTLGEGRLLACFYAHEDKLSTECQLGLYEAAATLDAAVNVFNNIAVSCKTDIADHCGDIKPGEGRILMCLKEKEKSVTEKCGKALSDVEIE